MHTHILQPRENEPPVEDCPACESIDPEHMTRHYAVVERAWMNHEVQFGGWT